MNLNEAVSNRGMTHVLDAKKNACVMLNDQGQEVHITKAMIVNACQQLLKQCRNIKN